MKVNFVVRDSKMGKDGTSPIELSVIVDGERRYVTLDRRCTPSKWDAKKQKVKGLKNSKELNEYIDIIRSKCYELEKEMLFLNMKLTADSFVNAFKNGIKNNIVTIEQAFAETLRAKINVSKCTIRKYNVTLRYLKSFLLEEFGYVDLPVCEITPNTCQLFFNFLLTKLSNNTAISRLKHLQSVLLYCRDEGYIHNNPCRVRVKKEKLVYNPLSKEQIQRLKNKRIDNERLNNVRDLFVFQCYTGLSYSDMASLTKDDIKGDMIIKNRRKTDVQSVIPILDVAREILEKYNYKLPILSNQKYNCYLKELGDICDIEQELHTHLARHTMATICINNGIDVNVIAKILGHSTIKTTLTIYAQFLTETVSKEKDKLNDIFK